MQASDNSRDPYVTEPTARLSPLSYEELITLERQMRGALQLIWQAQGKRMKIIECKPMSFEEYVAVK